MATYIYLLRDPDTMVVRYIGKSVHPYRRFDEHLKLYREGTHCDVWVKSLRSIGKKPLLEVVDQTYDGENWEWLEQQWIAFGRTMLWPLTNHNAGGAAAGSWSKTPEETRKKMRLAHLGRKYKPMSENGRRNIGLAGIGRKPSAGTLAKRSESMKGKNKGPKSEETKRRISESVRAYFANRGKDGR